MGFINVVTEKMEGELLSNVKIWAHFHMCHPKPLLMLAWTSSVGITKGNMVGS
jgi:hypothetical protein